MKILVEESTSFDEAIRNENWRQVMVEELKSITRNDTWKIAELQGIIKPSG